MVSFKMLAVSGRRQAICQNQDVNGAEKAAGNKKEFQCSERKSLIRKSAKRSFFAIARIKFDSHRDRSYDMTYTRRKAAGIQKNGMRIIPNACPLNVSIGGPVPVSPGFPLKTCGNDGLRKEN